jgi:ATP-dependent Clp protease protease subunit
MKFILGMLLLFSVTALSAEVIDLNLNNTVTLNDAVSANSVTETILSLAKLESNQEPVIYLVLNTPGGSVFDGLDLIQYLKGYKKPVKTVNIFSASMGFQIAQANPGERLITNTGVLMSHPVSGMEGGEFGEGMSIDNRIAYLKQIITTMDSGVVARTNGKQTLESYRKQYDNELWTTGDYAVSGGYADKVVDLSCASNLSSSIKSTQSRYYLEGPISLEIKYDMSSCPLSTSVLRYQIRFVNVVTGDVYILTSVGYDLPAQKSDGSNSLSGKSITGDIISAAQKNNAYKTLMFYVNREFRGPKTISTPKY